MSEGQKESAKVQKVQSKFLREVNNGQQLTNNFWGKD